jgi:transcriptional regulator with XRE-family HTH domain
MRLSSTHRAPARPLAEHIGRRLLLLRDAERWTLREVAERSGLSTSFVCEVENGHCFPGVDTPMKLATCFGVTLDYFVAEFQEAASDA